MARLVSGVVERGAVIPAEPTVAQMRCFIPDKARYRMQHRLDVPGRTAAAMNDLLNPEASYGSQERWWKVRESVKSIAGQFIRRKVQTGIRHTGIYAHFVKGGVQNRNNDKHHLFRGSDCTENVAKTPDRAGVPKKMMKKSKHNRSQDA